MFPLYLGGVVMTNHKIRGLELPGGKMEEGEIPVQAAIRETFEETGAVLEEIKWIGQYQVYQRNGEGLLIKSIYLGQVEYFMPLPPDSEALGYEIFHDKPQVEEPKFSFIVKDDVFQYLWKKVMEKGNE
ncbi:NUDIX domain-containing protein [Microaerobacter geothermalis]|uniref:NUDIX domain-containing protein n=1 Tax=Microaerobacter geothermalis TaxID=674972 RepID=UPI002E3753AB|nr:NUDIX domain-containing protein [Microaerobacter geothermalis]